MKRILVCLIMTSGLLSLSSQSSQAESRVADCLELKFGSSSVGSTTITLSAQVYAICNSTQLGRGNGQRPLYTVAEESSLLSLSTCSGPSATYTTTYGSGWIGNVTCTFPINQNFFGSQRTGATSSTIRMWFAWDFSEKSIAVTHGAVPYSCPTISCSAGGSSGGSSGDSSGGSSGGAATPVPSQGCTLPASPNLKYTYNDKGVLFTASLSTSGSAATSLMWSYAHFDIAGSVWGPWTKWATVSPAKEFTFQADKTDGKSRVVFSVYASNSCGDSDQARESESNTGILFVPISAGRFIEITPNSANSSVRADGVVLPSFKVSVTDVLGKGVGNVLLEISVSGVGKLISGESKTVVTTDASGIITLYLKSSLPGDSSVTIKSLTLGQFFDNYGVVAGVATPGARAGTYSVTGYVSFKTSEQAEMVSLEANESAKAEADAADWVSEPEPIELQLALVAANEVERLTSEVESLISELKFQVEMLSTLILKIQLKLKK